MSPIDPRSLESAQGSDLGRIRSAQEDLCEAFEHESGARLYVVADGMGGHRGGATASRMAVESMGEAFLEEVAAVDDLPAWLADSLRGANSRIYDASRADPDLRGMGTTAVALLVDGAGRAWLGHVGDSRAYVLRGGRMQRLTEDHSVVAEMVRRGLISEAEAEIHPRRNEILRSVGVEPEVVPELREIELRKGDRLLLCSDGLSGMVMDPEMGRVLGSNEPERAVVELIEMANDLGGPDNITALVVAVPGEAEAASATAPAPMDPGPEVVAASEPASASLSLTLLAALIGALLVFAWVIWQ